MSIDMICNNGKALANNRTEGNDKFVQHIVIHSCNIHLYRSENRKWNQNINWPFWIAIRKQFWECAFLFLERNGKYTSGPMKMDMLQCKRNKTWLSSRKMTVKDRGWVRGKGLKRGLKVSMCKEKKEMLCPKKGKGKCRVKFVSAASSTLCQ